MATTKIYLVPGTENFFFTVFAKVVTGNIYIYIIYRRKKYREKPCCGICVAIRGKGYN